jgi:hypothetical protein
VSKHLSFDPVRKAAWGNAMVANPALAGEIRLSGMKRGAWGNVAYGGNVNPPHNRKGGRGAWGNVAYGGNVNPPHNRKGGSGNPPPKGRRAPALSRLVICNEILMIVGSDYGTYV